LLEARAVAGEIDRALVVAQHERLARRFGRHILTEVAVLTVALDHESLHGENPVAAAQRGGGVVDDLLFGRRLRAGAAGERDDSRTKFWSHGFRSAKAFALL